MAFPNDGKKFIVGVSGNPLGRPKKYTTLLKDHGYKLSEINDTIQVMLQMTIEELKEVWENKQSTVLEKTIAAAIRKSIERGSLYSIETLLTRIYGKPKEMLQTTGLQKIIVEYVNANGQTVPSAPIAGTGIEGTEAV